MSRFPGGPAIGVCPRTKFALAFILSSTITIENTVDKKKEEGEEEQSAKYAGECGGSDIWRCGMGIRGDR